ncbi:MAG: preprotein translocase subunit SecG [Clostridia bacterium]|nr:preprotein translocase subunit SecG [Clostridia bacterium]
MSAKLFNILQYSLGGALIAFSVALVIVVLLQSAKDRRLSGTIAGGAETFFGKTKGKSADKVLSKITIVISVLVVLITLALNIIIAYNASLG